MYVIYFLVPISILVMAIAIWALFWALKHDQYDDPEGAAHQILFDDHEQQRQIETALNDANKEKRGVKK